MQLTTKVSSVPGFQCLSPKEGGVFGDVEKHYGEKECREDIHIFVPTHVPLALRGSTVVTIEIVCCFARDLGFT